MKIKDILLKIVLPFLVLAAGFAVMKKMETGRTMPQKISREDKGALVEILKVESIDKQIEVVSSGTVMAREEIVITPQVSGLVNHVEPNFLNGGFFKKGDILFTIEDIDYRLAMENAKASVAKSEFELATIEGKAKVALMEWKHLNSEKGQKPGDLLLFKPQLHNAKAGYASAKAKLEQSILNLNRTKIRAPFNCMVRSENIDTGQYVRSGNGVATITGTDVVEIIVPIRMADLKWLDIPGYENKKNGTNAVVSITVGGKSINWNGKLVRKLEEVDPKGRMARIIVTVEDPFSLVSETKNRYTLSLGLFVKVVFAGQKINNAIVIPRETLRDNSTIWLADKDNKLKIQPIEIFHQDRKELIIIQGLKKDDRVVKTNLTGAADGMKLRPISRETN